MRKALSPFFLMTFVIVACTNTSDDLTGGSTSQPGSDPRSGTIDSAGSGRAGGDPADIVVSVFLVGAADPVTGDVSPACLGTLLPDFRVLSAAHCLYDQAGELQPLLVQSGSDWISAGLVGVSGIALRSSVTGAGDVMVLEVNGLYGVAAQVETGITFGEGDVLTVVLPGGTERVAVIAGSCSEASVVCVEQVESSERRFICPGDSGAPLLDGDNRVVGVATRGDCASKGESVFSLLLVEDSDLLLADPP